MNKGEKVLYLILLVAIVAAVFITANSCDGTLVRGLFWYECIGE